MQGFVPKLLIASVAVSWLALLPVCFAFASDTSNGVVSAIEKKYQVTETTPDFEQITRDGTTMAMKCAGVYSIPSNLMVKPDNKVVEGRVQTPGMMVRMLWTKSGAHVLQTGDKVYITKIESKPDGGGDALRFTLLTVDALDVSGSDSKKKYDAVVSFKFKKGYLEETPPEEVEQAIESVLAPDEGGGDSGDQQAAAPASAPARPGRPAPTPGMQAALAAQRQPGPAPAPAPQALPVATVAPAGPPATISIGETSTEVLQAMGMPLQMIDLGKKKTYVYKNMKVVFLNDKVSDVQ